MTTETLEASLLSVGMLFDDVDAVVTMHPGDGGAPRHLSGPAMSVLRKNPDGRWVICRDANMITPAGQA